MDTEQVRKILRRLKYDNDTFYKVLTLVKCRNITVKPCKKAVKRLLHRFGEEMFFKLMNMNFESAEIARKIIADGECFSLKHLTVKGGDLVELGYSGQEIGKKLNLLLQAVISEKCTNEKQALIDYLITQTGSKNTAKLNEGRVKTWHL